MILASCRQTSHEKPIIKTESEWTTERIKKYFKDSIAHRKYNGRIGQSESLNDFDNFSKYILKDIKAKNIGDPYILGFDEEYIDTTKIDKNRKWFRISVDPCFRIPYCLILEQFKDRSELILKMTDGHGGYYSGFLNFFRKQNFADTLYSNISKELHQLDFWTLTKDTTCGSGTDGEQWTFEAIENGRYNILTRWVPLRCGNQNTKRLAEIGVRLRNKSQFKDYFHLQTKMPIEEIEEWYPDK